MHLVSANWEAAVRSSHVRETRVEVWRKDVKLIPDLPIDGGTVTWDLGDQMGASVEISVADPTYLPKLETDPLTPYGSYLRIYTGRRYGAGANEVEMLFVGEFPVVTVPTWAQGGSFQVTGTSWLRWVQDDRFLAPYSPAPGASVRATIDTLVHSSLPNTTVSHTGADATVPDGTVWEEDRWQAVTDLAGMVDCSVRPVPDGRVIVAPDPVPSPNTFPLRTIDAGPGGILLSGSRPALDRAERYNAVLARHPDDPTIQALATLPPTDPAGWGWPFGRKPMFYSSPLLTAGTVAAAAQTRLDNLRGRSRVIEVSMIPDPSIEPGDHVEVLWPDGARDLAMVRKVVTPLGLGEMSLELRGVPQVVTP